MYSVPYFSMQIIQFAEYVYAFSFFSSSFPLVPWLVANWGAKKPEQIVCRRKKRLFFFICGIPYLKKQFEVRKDKLNCWDLTIKKGVLSYLSFLIIKGVLFILVSGMFFVKGMIIWEKIRIGVICKCQPCNVWMHNWELAMKTLKEKKESQEIYEGIIKTAKPSSSKIFKLYITH